MKCLLLVFAIAAGDAPTVETDDVPVCPLEAGAHLRVGKIIFEAPNMALGGKAYTAQRVTIRHSGGVHVLQADRVHYPVDQQGQEFCRAVFDKVQVVGPAEVVFESYMGGRVARTRRIQVFITGECP